MCHPQFAHMHWDNRLIVRRVVRWVDAVREGRADRRIINIAAEFVPGGSIGPAWGARQEAQAEPEAPGKVPAPAHHLPGTIQMLRKTTGFP